MSNKFYRSYISANSYPSAKLITCKKSKRHYLHYSIQKTWINLNFYVGNLCISSFTRCVKINWSAFAFEQYNSNQKFLNFVLYNIYQFLGKFLSIYLRVLYNFIKKFKKKLQKIYSNDRRCFKIKILIVELAAESSLQT